MGIEAMLPHARQQYSSAEHTSKKLPCFTVSNQLFED